MTYTGHDLSIAVGFREDDTPPPHLPAGQRLRSEGVPRARIWQWLKRRYELLLPDAEIVEGDIPGPFNRAAARNDAVERATLDLVLLADADTIGNVEAIAAAAGTINAGGAEWALCFSRYVQLHASDSARIVCGPSDADIQIPSRVRWATNTGIAGLIMVTREAFNAVGGYDERYEAWSVEDTSLAMAFETLCHGAVRTPGIAAHLEHPRAPGRRNGLTINAPLFARYQAAHYNVEAMKALVAEPGRRTPREEDE